MRPPERIKVWVKFPHGAIRLKVFWWQPDWTIIRDACEKLGVLAPNPDQCTVEPRHD